MLRIKIPKEDKDTKMSAHQSSYMFPQFSGTNNDFLQTTSICLACNIPFFVPPNQPNTPSMFDTQYSSYYLETLNKVFELDSPEPVMTELHPFCSHCLKLVSECCQIKQQLEQLSIQLCKLRNEIGVTIVNSFPATSCHRSNYSLKRKIYERKFSFIFFISPFRYGFLFLSQNLNFLLLYRMVCQNQ